MHGAYKLSDALQDEGTLIVEGEPTAYLDTIDAYRYIPLTHVCQTLANYPIARATT